MFTLHETTQRRVCRGIFLVACVLPVLLTLTGVAYWNRPWREQDWQRSMAEQMHVRAAVERISSPRPGANRLVNMRLAELRSNRELGAIGLLDAKYEGTRLHLSADRLEIQADQLPELATAFVTWVATGQRGPFDFHVAQLSLVSSAQQTVQFHDISVSGDEQHYRLTAVDEAGRSLRLELQVDHGTIHAALDTQQSALPAWLIGKFVPAVGGGGNALFQGTLTIASENQRTRGFLTGKLADVDLQTWTGERGPKKIKGTAQVELTELRWFDQRIETARGTILANNGTATQSVLAGLCKHIHCVPAAGWESLGTPQSLYSADMVPYERLALGFQLSSAGIAFDGKCAEGAILVSAGRPLLYGPREKGAHPVVNLVNLLHLPRRSWMPDTRASLEMASGLPLPGDEDEKPVTIQK